MPVTVTVATMATTDGSQLRLTKTGSRAALVSSVAAPQAVPIRIDRRRPAVESSPLVLLPLVLLRASAKLVSVMACAQS